MTPTTPWRGYRPGSWYGILGSGALVLLPPGEKSRVPAVWALVDDGAGFDEVLDALIADGLRDLAGFVLVSSRDGGTRVVVRGPATAVLTTEEGDVRVEGASAVTWVEREVRRVSGLRVEVDDPDAGDHDSGSGGGAEQLLVLRDGLVRVSAVVEPAPPAPVPDEVVPEDVEPEEVEPEEPPAVAEEPATEPVAEPAPAPGPVARLVMSHGETVDVDRPVVLGRAPEAGPAEDAGEPRLVALPSPSREISGTHLEVRPGSGPDVGTAVVTDLGSTNGSVLVQPGMPPEELQPGVPVRLLTGAVIDLGDGISLEVVAP